MAKTKNPIEAVSEVRQQITETQTQIEDTRSAKADLQEALANVQKCMDRVIEDASRNLQLHQFGQPGYSPTNSCGLDNLSAFTLAVLTNPKGTKEYIEREIKEHYLLDGPTVSEADRPALIAELEKQTWKLEAQEERLIEEAEAAGTEIARRGDCKPEIVLGLAKGENPAWDWTSDKLDAIVSAADAAQSLYRVRTDAWMEAKQVHTIEKNRLEIMERESQPEPSIKDQRRTVEYAQKAMDRAAAQRAEAEAAFTEKVACAGNLQRWVQENRKRRPSPYTQEDFQIYSQKRQVEAPTPKDMLGGGHQFGEARSKGIIPG